MLIVGLTGGIGSGKSTVANLFAAKGVPVIDTDQLARDVTKPGTVGFKKIIAEFGTDILQKDNTLNRRRLRQLIFDNPKKRDWLEKLLHPLIRQELKKQISLLEEKNLPYCIVVIPLLFETEVNPIIQRILVVDAPKISQIERTKKRDQMTDGEVENIIQAQVSQELRLQKADDIIYNHSSLEHLNFEVDKLHHYYLSRKD